jgi:hypothetical protein
MFFMSLGFVIHILNISKVDKKINLELEIINITNLYYASIEIFTQSMMMILNYPIKSSNKQTNKQTNKHLATNSTSIINLY